jgi:uncharacterized membrane protein
MGETSRFYEIDFLRGIAILMMVIFHTIFDLSYFGIWQVVVSSGFWRFFALSTASLFLLIVGVSFSLSYSRAYGTLPGKLLFLKFLYRGIGIFLLGLLVTLGTWLYLGEGYIVFGILHLIGVSVILAPFFYRFGKYNIPLGIACIAAGFVVMNFHGPIWLLPLGVTPATFWSVDYTPIFPWFGMVLIGIGAGEMLYPRGNRRFNMPQVKERWEALITSPGRHSLLIYMVHQPVIILILHFTTGMVPV